MVVRKTHCPKPTSFETVAESVGHLCPLSLAMTDTPLRHLQGAAWLGRFHYKEIPGLYSTPERSKGKNKSTSGFSKKPLHKSISTYIHVTFSVMLIALIQGIGVQMDRLPGAFILPQSACQYTCGFKPAARISHCSVHPSQRWQHHSPRHPWSPTYFVAVIQVRFQFILFCPYQFISTVLSPQSIKETVNVIFPFACVFKWNQCGSFR